jgi:putative ABC transport system permease protein
MNGFWHDLVLAVRSLRQSPGLAAAAILTLALGIGANATIYSLADAVLFRPLEVPDADRIVHIFQRRHQPGNYPLSLADYPHYRDHARSFEALAAHYATAPLNVLVDGAPESVTGAVATANYFDVLQMRPTLGRFFLAAEDQARDRDAVTVISHGFWQRRFAGDRSVLGKAVQINGRSFTIVGVAPPGFAGVRQRGPATDLWIPSAMFRVGYRYCNAFERTCTIVQLLGRLKPGVAIEQSQQELDVLFAQLGPVSTTNAEVGVTVLSARGLGLGSQLAEEQQIYLFLGVVALVLVIACANIAGLLLARTTARRRELAVRLALGAGRGRIVRQVLAESVVLAGAGGVAGLLVSTWGTDFLSSLYSHDSAGRPIAFDMTINGTVVTATVALTLFTALLAGVTPAWHASRGHLVAVLKDEGASGGARRARLRGLLVAAQVAVCVVLLIGAALLIQSAYRAFQGPGFSPDHLITVRLRPSLVDYPRDRAHAYQRDVVRTLESLPGVVSASPSVYMSMFSAGLNVTAQATTAAAVSVTAISNPIGPRYFETLAIPLVEGREFTARDRTGAPLVAVVNDVLARQLWPDSPVAGRALQVNGQPHTVVGVVRDAQYYPTGDPPRAQVFLSYWQPRGADTFLNDSRVFIRVAGDAAQMMAAVRRAVAAVDSAVPISEDHPLADRLVYAFQPVRMARGMLTSFAVLAVVLSAVGLYGVLAFSVAQRTREIGVRMALGARPRDIASVVLRDAAVLTAAGISLGLVAAWNTAQFATLLLFGLDARDPTAFVAAPVLLAIVALTASYVPARRAVNVLPLTALRSE